MKEKIEIFSGYLKIFKQADWEVSIRIHVDILNEFSSIEV